MLQPLELGQRPGPGVRQVEGHLGGRARGPGQGADDDSHTVRGPGQLGRRQVRANCILPGFLETKFTADLPAAARERILAMHELGRFNTIAEVARFIAFLDTMPFVSGQVFQLDSRISPWT